MAQETNSLKQRIEDALHEDNAFTQLLGKIEIKTGVNRMYIVAGFASLLGLYLMMGYGSQFVCNFVCFIYPAYMSIKAVESPDKKDDTQWLTYWVVYSLFHLVELVTDRLLYWMSSYWFLKCCFLVWCFSGVEWNGSDVIYNNVIRPFVLGRQKEVDAALDTAEEVAIDALDVAKEIVHVVLDRVHMNEQERKTEAVINELREITSPHLKND